ncbi:hypothetical protein [Bombella apis]|uniref:hypothetical protein n=1 Tax=Bombella apis TaxID=1785988 RepID=UPI0023F1A5BA|nr:hypothetical protein [Bombella apis]MCT6845149.1 hypothetical protein [Bombella apis]
MMIGKIYHSLASGLSFSKRWATRSWRLVLLLGGVGLVSLVPESAGWSAGCVCLGLMMQLAALLSGRHPGWFVFVPIVGVLGWYAPALSRVCDQLAIYGLMLWGMLWLFVRSLRRGQVPLVTRLAGAVHGTPLRADVQRYTVGVTWAWSIFFTLALLAPLMLWLWAPHERAWRWPLEGGTGLAAVVFFAVEMIIRRLVIRHYDHSTLKQNFMAGRAVFMRKDLK